MSHFPLYSFIYFFFDIDPLELARTLIATKYSLAETNTKKKKKSFLG